MRESTPSLLSITTPNMLSSFRVERSHSVNINLSHTQEQAKRSMSTPASVTRTDKITKFAQEKSLSIDDDVKEIENVCELLPSWVPPNLIYPWHTIRKTQFLGAGEYGIVYKGTYTHGNAK